MAKYRVTRMGRPSPIDWPLVEVVAWVFIVAGGLFLLALDWTLVGVTP
jgi:hypothetical protein